MARSKRKRSRSARPRTRDPRRDPAVAAAHSLYLAGELTRALEACHRILARAPEHVDARHLAGIVRFARGEYQAAVNEFNRAIAGDPEDHRLYNSLGNAWSALYRFDAALGAYQRAVEIEPNDATAHSHIGLMLQNPDLGRLDEAEAAFERALEIEPASAPLLANLASFYEQSNRLEEAGRVVARGLARAPGEPRLNLVAARLDRRAKRFADGVGRLRRVLHGGEERSMEEVLYYELGWLLEGMERNDEAFEALSRANRIAARRSHQSNVDPESFVGKVDRLLARFTAQWVGTWSASCPPDEGQGPVFLIGFPRSGTTLLDRVLDSHPRLCTLEEQPTVATLEAAARALPGGYPDGLAGLDREATEALRAAYRDAVRRLGPEQGKIPVDKMPLSTVNVGLIWRVFPNAKFLFAVRHPYDVCLSCFMQQFAFNPAMASFFTLEGTARLYDKVMQLWLRYTALLPIDHHVVRYEDLVDDLETVAAGALEFLGVGYHPEVKRFSERARSRERIDTPSYQQVVQPLYRGARYRWRRYERHLEPIRERIAPYVSRFGYQS